MMWFEWKKIFGRRLNVAAMLLGYLLIGLALALVLLCCSARLRSSLSTLAIGIAILIAPMFFPMSKKSGLWNHINYLFPARGADFKTMLGSFVSYTVGDHVISYVGMLVIVYVVIGVVALLLIRREFVFRSSLIFQQV